MKADKLDLAAIFGKPIRYLVPLFQRPYVWKEEEQWQPLWDDIEAVLERELADDGHETETVAHFLGAVVFDQVPNQTGMLESRYVIDGQQRLTTLQILIAAARSLAQSCNLDAPAQMLEKLLVNDAFLVRRPEDRLKVFPTTFDRAAFAHAVTRDGDLPGSEPRLMEQAYQFFRGAVSDWAITGRTPDEISRRFEVLGAVVWKLLIVVAIDLDRGDDAQVIFETLTARGTPLLAADLIKNHVFQAGVAARADIDALYEKYWQPLDSDWWRAYVAQGRLFRPRLDVFINHWLSMRMSDEVRATKLFVFFKRYLASRDGSVDDLLRDMSVYARVFESFEKAPETTRKGMFFYRLGIMETTTAFPALLWIFGPDGIRDEIDQDHAVAAIESWLVRRMLVRATTKNYNNIFRSLVTRLQAMNVPRADEVITFLHESDAEGQYWPTDQHVADAVRSLSAYTSLTRARLRMVLEAIEEQLRAAKAEQVTLTHDLTVEHVLPQEWRTYWSLPPDSDPILAGIERDALKETLGNLTLVTGRLNPAMSNGPWPDKRKQLRENSVLLLTSDIRDAETWDESAIRARTERLVDVILRIWPSQSAN
ncbi:MAG: DUF262 domain-containing protein [Candidatus Limnocylindrales bacterium]